MTQRMERAWAVGLGVGALVVALAAIAADATPGDELRGVWTAERSKWRVKDAAAAIILQLSLRRSGGHGNWSSSQPVPIGELAGLSAAQLDAPSAEAAFRWRRDAGSFDFEGRFAAGDGAGHFRFTPNPSFSAEMRQQGYGDIDGEKALSLATHDVSRALVAELASLGYRRLSLDDLVSLRIHGATPEYIRGLAGLGYRQVPVDDLVALRIHGASLDFVRDLQSLGYSGVPVEDLVSFRIHGVTPEFVKELKGLGYSSVPVEDLVSLRIHGVTGDYIRRIQQSSGKGVTLERLVSMRIHGVDPE
jgi:hypothetical protein